MATPYPSLLVRFVIQGVSRDAVALLDTGFDGYLAIPESLIASLPLPVHRRRVQTAGGQIFRVPVYLRAVELVDHPGPFDALILALGDEYLLGLAALNHFRVTFDHGQRLIVES